MATYNTLLAPTFFSIFFIISFVLHNKFEGRYVHAHFVAGEVGNFSWGHI
jgi:hypothetical protein